MENYTIEELNEMLEKVYLSNDFDDEILKDSILNELLKRENN